MTKKNEWQSIADDIDVESNTENKVIEKENKDNKTEYIWDKI